MLATAARHEDPQNTKFGPSPVPTPRNSLAGSRRNSLAGSHDQSSRRGSRSSLGNGERRPSLSAPPDPSNTLAEAKQEHHEWASRMWARMDRDNNGKIMRKELDCEEFRSVLRLVLAPFSSSSNPGGGGATYARSQTNQEEALHYCLRKADVNNDGWLSFDEFKAFMWVLRREDTAQDTTALVFALFDCDTDNHINESEFREIYRFYLGHDPTSEQFWHEWHKLASEGQALVSRQQYATWMRTSASPIFCQHAPAPVTTDAFGGAAGSLDLVVAPTTISTISTPSRRSRGILIDERGWPLAAKKDINARLSKWNQRFNTQISRNDVLPLGERNYFSRTQSLPQLCRFYNTFSGFETQLARVTAPPEPKEMRVLSTDTQPVFNKARHKPAGTMREHIHGSPCGDIALWEDNWPTPLRYKSRPRASDRPLPAHGLLEASYTHIGPMAKMLNRKYG